MSWKPAGRGREFFSSRSLPHNYRRPQTANPSYFSLFRRQNVMVSCWKECCECKWSDVCDNEWRGRPLKCPNEWQAAFEQVNLTNFVGDALKWFKRNIIKQLTTLPERRNKNVFLKIEKIKQKIKIMRYKTAHPTMWLITLALVGLLAGSVSALNLPPYFTADMNQHTLVENTR